MSMERIIHAVVFTPLRHGRWGLPVVYRSIPGAGKTDILEAFGKSWSLPVVTLSPGMQGEGVFGTTPVPYSRLVKDIKLMMLGYPAPEYVLEIAEGGIVFLDEISSTDVALQAPLLGIIQARQVGFYKFHPRVRVFGAANPVELAANGTDLAASVANRLGWYDWEPPSVDDWCSWIMRASGVEPDEVPQDTEKRDPLAEEARVLAEWPNAWAQATGLVTSFLRRKGGDLLSRCPKVGDPALSGAWPSHRSWENATRAYASGVVHGLDKADQEMMVGGFIGEGARDELFAYEAEQGIPLWSDVLDGAVSFKHDPARADITYTVLNTCLAGVLPKNAPKRDSRVKALWKIIKEVDKSGGFDMTEPLCFDLTKSGLHVSDEAVDALDAQRALLDAAGINHNSARRRR